MHLGPTEPRQPNQYYHWKYRALNKRFQWWRSSRSSNRRITVHSGRLRCPVCKSQHKLLWANREMRSLFRLLGYDKLAKKTALEKEKVIEDVGGCWLCTRWKHTSAVCHQRMNGVIACNIESEGSRCNKEHHKSLQLASSAYCQATVTTETHSSTEPRKARDVK